MDTSNKPLQLASKLLKGIGGSTTRALACISLPNPVDTDCEIRDYRVLGSYNLLDTQTPTILIPGLPRVWQEPSLPLQLSPDHGYAFIDQNAWRCHESPLEPIFRSILVTQKLLGNNSFSLSGEQIDIVTDRNNMRKLNAMIRSMRSQEALAPNKNREFRIDARLAPNGRTLLLTRYSDQLRQMINPSDGSYGANFERATTIKRAPILISNNGKSGENEVSPCSYHRIAKYRLADLNLLVRYEVDAVQDDSPVDGLPTLEQQSLEQKTIETQNNSTLCHIVSGTLVSQDRVMELKSGKLKWTQIFPQLYFSQTPLLKVGVHQNGNLSKVENHLIDQSYNGRAVDSHRGLIDNMRYLVPLLKEMRQACQHHGHLGQPLAFFWSGAGLLQLYEITKHIKRSHTLPKGVLESL